MKKELGFVNKFNIEDAINAVNDYVRDLAINHGYNKNVYYVFFKI